MRTRIMKLTRMRAHADAGGGTLFFKADGHVRGRRHLFFDPEAVPEFDGEEAWFLAERAPGRDWRIVRRVAADGAPWAGPETADA